MSSTLEVRSSSSSRRDQPLFYRRVRVLGKGSHGVVCSAAITKSDGAELARVAVKTSFLEEASTLRKEFRVLKALRGCPEIVRCFTDHVSLEAGHVLYNLFLEYAPLGTLKDLIAQSAGVGLPERDVRVYARMIVKGLVFVHENGYVHCDVKPENILAFRGPFGPADVRVKIADFGLAKEPVEELPAEKWVRRFRGTPDFMSPESVALGAIGPELDVWSLGCVVLEMMTGKNMWCGLKYRSSQMLVFALACLPLSPAVPGHVSQSGKDFLNRCLERNPRKRWTAQMLLSHPYLLLDY